jgi:hypothetical protein
MENATMENATAPESAHSNGRRRGRAKSRRCRRCRRCSER